ncbi:hypothetical protein [Salinibaculum rarum]|uniref:hypothetical protein n=1 Tax=Salinibaculum rarum TaxID=3058903 RepID=UPI00265F8250|nr:hypothetical protein [Salinibaculum sp. KK48]
MSEDSVSVPLIAVAVILVGMLLSGPVGGVDLVPERPSLDEGTASVTVIEPTADSIRVTEGRFGTNVSYVRIPDLVIDVTSVEGQPRVLYQVTVPDLNIRKQNDKLVQSNGRLRVPISDHAVVKEGALDGVRARLVVRVQSYSGETVVMNRTVAVQRG